MKAKLERLIGASIYPSSIVKVGQTSYFLARKGLDKLVGAIGPAKLAAAAVGQIDTQKVVLGPTDSVNAAAIRRALPWTCPRLIGLATSAGLGDRLGLATPGHIHAIRDLKIEPVLAQQSIREMTRTQRSAQQVIDAAMWGVFQEGFYAAGDTRAASSSAHTLHAGSSGYGADADHLQQLEDIDVTVEAGFTMFTIDPGKHVEDAADTMDARTLAARFENLNFDGLEISPADLKLSYAGRKFLLEGDVVVSFDEESFLRAAVKYGNAIAHVVRMYRHLAEKAKGQFELEVSVDETASPTSPAEHYFFAAELKRLDVNWVSMAPRFVGRFEKGVDYIGDLSVFESSFAEHAAVMRTLGPYKISIHSGSDKFSIYAIVAKLTDGLVHLKTAGTSYLEALRALAMIDPDLFREILAFARQRYETDKATYHVSAELARVPAPEALLDAQLPALLDDFHARQVLHVTFGSVLTAEGGSRFRDRLIRRLQENEEVHYAALEKHLRRHVLPLVR
jgi:tagaturonate epimerase